MDHENECKLNSDDSDLFEANSENTTGRTILKDVKELISHLEMMHDRRIVRNLQSAGLSNFGFDEDDEETYRTLDPHAIMKGGEPLLLASIIYIKDIEQQLRYTAILLCEGADPNGTDDKGKTALMYSCILGYEKSVKALLQNDSINLLQQDSAGNTALMYSASFGRMAILKHYVKTLRKIEKQNKSSAKIVKDNESSLFEIAFEMENNQGMNAATLALENNHFECAEFIEDIRSKYSKGTNKKMYSQNSHASTNSSKNLDSSSKYRTQAGSSESLHSDRALKGIREVNPSSRRLVQTRQSAQFQSHQDLYSSGYAEQNSSLHSKLNPNLNLTLSHDETRQHCLPTGKLAINIGIKVSNNERATFMQSKNELIKDLVMTKSLTESELSTSMASYQPPNIPYQKKNFAQGIMNIFKRRPKVESFDHHLNHSLSETNPPYCNQLDFIDKDNDQEFRSKSNSVETTRVATPKKSRRKSSVDIGLRAFHQFMDHPALGACPSLGSHKKPLTDKNSSPPASASGWSMTNQANFNYPYHNDNNISMLSKSKSDIRGKSLPPLTKVPLSAEEKLRQKETLRANQQVLNQMWPIKDDKKSELAPVRTGSRKKKRSQSAENFFK